MIHLIFCIVFLCNVVTFGSRTKIVNRHWFVTFHNRGFPFLLGPVRTSPYEEK